MHTMKRLRIAAAVLVLLGSAWPAGAQEWRGLGRISGKVVDQDKNPIEGATVKAFMPTAKGGTDVRTNKKGEWAIGGMAEGDWQLDITKNGFEARRVTVEVSEAARVPPIEIVLQKTAADPNVELRGQFEQAASLLNAKKYAEARAIYEAILAKYPEVHQVHPLIARTYYAEKNLDKSIEHLRHAVQKDPQNVDVRLLLANVLVEKGSLDEARQILDGVDAAKIADPTVFLNLGIALFNQKKPAEAKVYVDKFLAAAPNSPEAETAKKLLEKIQD